MKLLLGLLLTAATLLPGDLPSTLRPIEEFSAGLDQRAPINKVAASYEPVAIPIAKTKPNLAITATSAIAIDLATGAVLYEKAAAEARPIASITKLVTVLTILRSHKLDETVTIPTLPNYAPNVERLGLVPGQKFSVRDLVQACLIKSANDAADALAIWDSGSIAAFTPKMDALMAEWQLAPAAFTDASGLSPKNTASALALAKLASLAITVESVKSGAAARSATIKDAAGTAFPLASTNRLLADSRFTGLKTGYTGEAGQCFVSLARVNGHSVITVVLGSEDRFGETTALINLLERTYLWL